MKNLFFRFFMFFHDFVMFFHGFPIILPSFWWLIGILWEKILVDFQKIPKFFHTWDQIGRKNFIIFSKNVFWILHHFWGLEKSFPRLYRVGKRHWHNFVFRFGCELLFWGGSSFILCREYTCTCTGTQKHNPKAPFSSEISDGESLM